MKLIKAEIFGGNIIRHFYVTFNGVWKPCMSSKSKRKSSKIQTNIKTVYLFVCFANIVYLLHHLQFHKRICTFYPNWLEPDEKKHMMHLFTFWPPAAQRWQFRRKLGEMRRWEMGGREPQKPSRFPLLQQEVRRRLSKHIKSYSGFNGVSVSLFCWEPEQRSLLKQRK